VPPQIGVEVERMQGIIEHQMSRAATTGGKVIGQAPVPIAPIVQELRLTLLKVHGRKDLSIEASVPPELQFLGDRADLTEALGNLIDNACKWCAQRVRIDGELLSDAGSKRAQLASRGQIRLRIEDDGPGMPAELRAQGPRRGLRADESTPGHGIGLAMVADMAELYGGELQLGSSPLGGARVDLMLPGSLRSRT
jgi:two-component system sensor histidine kinase PhoQ